MRGHRGMGIRSQRKTEMAAGCRGMGSRPVRLTTPRYDPLVVTLHCTSVYVQGVVAANRETLREASIGPRKQKPRARGALTGATEGLGELEAARRQGRRRGDLVPIENPKQPECGAFPPSLGARPALRCPRSPPVFTHPLCRKWRKGGGATINPHMLKLKPTCGGFTQV